MYIKNIKLASRMTESKDVKKKDFSSRLIKKIYKNCHKIKIIKKIKQS